MVIVSPAVSLFCCLCKYRKTAASEKDFAFHAHFNAIFPGLAGKYKKFGSAVTNLQLFFHLEVPLKMPVTAAFFFNPSSATSFFQHFLGNTAYAFCSIPCGLSFPARYLFGII